DRLGAYTLCRRPANSAAHVCVRLPTLLGGRVGNDFPSGSATTQGHDVSGLFVDDRCRGRRSRALPGGSPVGDGPSRRPSARGDAAIRGTPPFSGSPGRGTIPNTG